MDILSRVSPLPRGIEGACRYLVKDRMELTGTRWSPEEAEAVLRLRWLWIMGAGGFTFLHAR
jgi:hypothetical protein